MSTQTTRLHVEGMTCPHCVETVERALLAMDGVQAATVDLEEMEAVVQYDPNLIELNTLVKGVVEAGYQASVMAGARA